jgi:geranylgeranyl pyrophosphate synthase
MELPFFFLPKILQENSFGKGDYELIQLQNSAKAVDRDFQVMLDNVNNLLHNTVDTRDVTMREMALYFLSSLGKLLRPTLTLASGLIRGETYKHKLNELYTAAAGVEMIHMSALVHDDIIDRAEVRRGKPTVNAVYGEGMALLLGDYFYSKALSLFSDLGHVSILKQALRVIAQMAEGEVKQKREAFNLKTRKKDYFLKITRKTASLIAFSCYAGAGAAELPEDEQITLSRFGSYLGKAYQIRDDILDFLNDEKNLKKPANDLKTGILTLPAIIAIEGLNDTAYGLLNIEALKIDGQHMRAAKKAAKYCNGYVNKAKKVMQIFPESSAKQKVMDTIEKVYIFP